MLISLFLFAAAALFWHWGEQEKALHRGSATNAPGTQAVSPELLPQTPAAATSTNQAGVPLPARSAARLTRDRLSNTQQTLKQLERNDRAVLLRNALIDTTKPLDFKIPDTSKRKRTQAATWCSRGRR